MNTCENCKHFKQHYTKTDKGYSKLPFGFCKESLTQTQITTCKNWEKAKKITNKELLASINDSLSHIANFISRQSLGK